jgi:hypothetical protein
MCYHVHTVFRHTHTHTHTHTQTHTQAEVYGALTSLGIEPSRKDALATPTPTSTDNPTPTDWRRTMAVGISAALTGTSYQKYQHYVDF